MATFTVTTNTDVVDANDGVTSLREAVILANGSAGADTIDFASDLAGSTVELEGKLVLATDVTINGDTNQDGDADITLSGSINDNALIEVFGSSAFDAVVSLTSLNITSTVAGEATITSGVGVIKNAGILTVTYCSLEDNFVLNTANSGSAGTIVNTGNLTVNQSTFENNRAIAFQGGDNTRGGSAAAGILNLYAPYGGYLTVGDTLFSGGTAIAGNGNGVGIGGSAALGVLNLSRKLFSGTGENDSADGRVTAGVGGSAGGDDGQLSLTNLNVGDNSGGSIAQVALGTMGANTFKGNGNFNGLGGDDNITGNTGTTISGGTGNDRLTGGANVTANGGLGDDMLVCTLANGSTFDGGEGIDTISFSLDSLSGETIDLSTASFGFSGSTFTGFENAIGSQDADTIIGGKIANVLNGANGDDTINGGRGNDRLIGGGGLDTLTGGIGLDVFELAKLPAHADIITDFTSGKDSLEISAADFGSGLVAGDLAASRFRANATGLAGDLNDRFILNTANGQLFFDSNGSAAGGARLIATFTGTSTGPIASDFDIV